MKDEKKFLDELDDYIYFKHLRENIEKHAVDHEKAMGKLPDGQQIQCGLRRIFHVLDEIEKRRRELHGTPE